MDQKAPAPHFNPERLKRLSEIEGWHFWFVGRRVLLRELVKTYLDPDHCLVGDLGCGTCKNLKFLVETNYRVLGLDLRPEGLHETHRANPELWLVQGDLQHLPLKEAAFDAVLALDVLEHVDDRSALAGMQRILKPGGLLFLTVPAIPWLWSYRDRAAGHLRRYTRRSLAQVLVESGFEMVKINHYQFFLFPMITATRLVGRNGPQARDLEEQPSNFANSLLAWITSLEVHLGRLLTWPWGSSLYAVCQRML